MTSGAAAALKAAALAETVAALALEKAASLAGVPEFGGGCFAGGNKGGFCMRRTSHGR